MDQIRIIVGNSNLEEWIEVTEDDEGYGELIRELSNHLSGFPSAGLLLQRIALPPFETKWTQIHRRDAAST
jgi:hypothetical protein